MAAQPEETAEVKQKIASEFYDWIIHARELVDAHFPNEAASAHNTLVLETAKSMMMMHELSGIKDSVDDFLQSIQYSNGS